MPVPFRENRSVVALLVLNGMHAGSRFRLPDVPTVLGRSTEAHYQIDDPWVSNMHALFETRDQVLWVVDLDSRNGTYLGASRIREAPVAVGSVLAFGRTEVRVEAVGGSPLATPPHHVSPALLDGIRATVRSDRPEGGRDLESIPMAVLRLALAVNGAPDVAPPLEAIRAAAAAVLREGGRGAPVPGGGLVALFGQHGSAPDDCARALRAAAAIRRHVVALHPGLSVRLSVDHGPVVPTMLQEPDGAELTPAGPTAMRLERVLAEAKTGEILAGPGVPANADDRLEPIGRGAPDLPLRRLRIG